MCDQREGKIGTINKNTETLIDANKEVGIEINTEKTKYMFESHYQNADQIRTRKQQTNHWKIC
jgi:hypothetical protein